MAGNRAVADLLASPGPADAPTIQRNIGFEFENTRIHIRKVAEAEKVAKEGRAGLLDDNEWPPLAPEPFEAKKPVLPLEGGPATLEADDTLGTGKEDVEIVVPRLEPYKRGFPLTKKGRKAMEAALGLAADFALRAGKVGTGHLNEVNENSARAREDLKVRREKWAAEHAGLELGKHKKALKKRAPEVWKELEPALKAAKKYQKARDKGRQATLPWSPSQNPFDRIRKALVRLELIEPEPMGEFGEFRALTAVSEFWTSGDNLVLANAAPADGPWAVHVTMGIPLTALNERLTGGLMDGRKALAYLEEKQIPGGPDLAGFVRLVASYLSGAQFWPSEQSKNPKQMVDLLARNSFATMFGQLPKETRIAIAKDPGVWLAAWETESKRLAKPFLEKPGVLETSYSGEQWLKGMIGTVNGEEHVEGLDLISTDESLDSMGKWTQFDTGREGAAIPIFEDRLRVNWAPAEWMARGEEFFKMNRSLLKR